MTSQLDSAAQTQLQEIQGVLKAFKTGKNPTLSDKDKFDAIQLVMSYLKDKHASYYWVGVYKLAGETLVVGPYVGPKTDHVRIPVGRGVCGTAVAENKNQIVADVRELENYLACNLETRSEIVVLVREPDTQKILGQIDIDSTKLNAFGKAEEAFLEEVAALIAPYF